MNFNQELQEDLEIIEEILRKSIPNQKEMLHQGKIAEAMEYALLSGGKRIRPILMYEVYKMYGGQGKEIESFIAAMEMIHTYSLVHDDLPAMDNDDYRRGRKTTHIVYGEAMGILAGDALLTYAFEVASRAFTIVPDKSVQIGKALQVLSNKSGVFGMLGGQVVDVCNTNQILDIDLIHFIFELKTAALIEASMMIGAILAGADEEVVTTMESIARSVGIAFQIQDDILDVTSTTKILGKPILSDEKNSKTTYVSLFGIEESKKEVDKLTKYALTLLRQQNKNSDIIERLMEALVYREK